MKVTLGSLRVFQSGEQDVEETCITVDSSVQDADDQNGRSKQFTCSAEAKNEQFQKLLLIIQKKKKQ